METSDTAYKISWGEGSFYYSHWRGDNEDYTIFLQPAPGLWKREYRQTESVRTRLYEIADRRKMGQVSEWPATVKVVSSECPKAPNRQWE